jgi:dienelactone hydrolase
MKNIVSLVMLAVIATMHSSYTSTAHAQSKLEPYYNLLRPDGSGPFPALLLVPGSPGVVGNRPQQAEALKELGYVVIFVDFLSARGLQSGSGGQVSRAAVAQDISESVRYLRSQRFIDPTRIGAIGWSLGGGSVLAALARANPDQPPPFHAAAVFYATCRGLQPWEVKVPILMHLGALDDATPPELCQQLVNTLPAGYPIEVKVYPNARHSFDRIDLPARQVRRARGGSTGYNAEAASLAWDGTRKFFAKHLKAE